MSQEQPPQPKLLPCDSWGEIEMEEPRDYEREDHARKEEVQEPVTGPEAPILPRLYDHWDRDNSRRVQLLVLRPFQWRRIIR